MKFKNLRSLEWNVLDGVGEIEADFDIDPPPPTGEDRYEFESATAVFTSGDFQPFCDREVNGGMHAHTAYQKRDADGKPRWFIFDLVDGTERPLHRRNTAYGGQSGVNENFAWLPDGRYFFLSGNRLRCHGNSWDLPRGYQYRLGTGSGYRDNFVKRDRIGGTTETLIHITEDGPEERWNVRESGILNGFHAIHVLEGYGYAYSPHDSRQHIVYSCRWDGTDQKNLEGDSQRWSHQTFDGGIMAVNDVTTVGDSIDIIDANGAGSTIGTVPMFRLGDAYRPDAYIQSIHHQLVGKTLYVSAKDHAKSTRAIEESGVLRIDFTDAWELYAITVLARGIQHPGPAAGGVEHWEGQVQPAGDPAGGWICYRENGKLIVKKQEEI